MAKKRSAKRAAAPRRTIPLLNLHREFKNVRLQVSKALAANPSSPTFRQLEQDLTNAEMLMDCTQTGMAISG